MFSVFLCLCSSSEKMIKFQITFLWHLFCSLSVPCLSYSTHNREKQRAAIALNSREDQTQTEAPCIYLYNYHCLFLSVYPSLGLFSSLSVLQPSSLSALLLSTVWTHPFCSYTLSLYPTIPSLFPLCFPLSFSLTTISG